MKSNSTISTLTCILFIFCTLSVPARGQNSSSSPDTTEKNSTGQIVPLMEGKTAPFTGLLVPEGRFTQFLDTKLDNDDLRGRLKIQTNLTNNLEDIYLKRLDEATKPPKWYKTNSFNFWLGFAIGIVASAAAVYGAVEIVKAAR